MQVARVQRGSTMTGAKARSKAKAEVTARNSNPNAQTECRPENRPQLLQTYEKPRATEYCIL